MSKPLARLRQLVCCLACLTAMLAQAQKGPEQEASYNTLYNNAAYEIHSGNRNRAQQLLGQLEQTPPAHAGAWLDVALLYCQNGQNEDAERLFQLIENRFAPPHPIRQLISYYRQGRCNPRPPPISFSVSTYAGHTTNVNSGPDTSTIRLAPTAPLTELKLLPSNLAHSDQYLGMDLAASRKLDLDGIDGLQMLGLAQLKRYAHNPDFSTAQIVGGLGYKRRLQQGEWDMQVYYSHLVMGSRTFETSTNLQTGIWQKGPDLGGKPFRWGMDALLSSQRYPDSPLYNASRVELRLKGQVMLVPGGNLVLQGGPVFDRPHNDNRPGGNRKGYVVALGYDQHHGPEHQWSVYAQRQQLDDDRPYNTVFFGEVIRKPITHQFVARYQYNRTRREHIFVQFTAQQISDPIDLFAIKSQNLSVGYLWNF
ncbi:MAG: hypothetical protein H6R04_1396 [Burkholderiaceae bacterium]|nr:hypothetical protein [Burkholderiaceae bacterium]